MKITLISPYPDITSFGIRTLSACLKQKGHSTQLLFLPDPLGDDITEDAARYDERVLDQASELCRASDLIGITLMTNFFDGAVQITRKLKERLKSPVIWGGVHPTVRPEEALEHADMVCVGEGEACLMELADKMAAGQDYRGVTNLWTRSGDSITRNPLSPLPQDLDAFPVPDYSMDDHHVMIGKQIVPLTHEIMKSFLGRGTVAAMLRKTGYQTMTSRGCPYSCTYCINDTIKNMYGGKGKLRWRSIPHVMNELQWVKDNMPYVDYIWISDDEFMSRKPGDIRMFCKEYKKKIGFPFSCLISPLTVTEEKMAALVDAGLIYVQMGIESGSARMQELFRRKQVNNERMFKAIRIINSFKDKLCPPSYDFLLDVPYETDEDRLDNLRFIAQMPKPYRLQPFTLILYPGTQMHEQAMRDGLIQDEHKEIYNKTYTMRKPDYLNLLMTLAKGGRFPHPILRLLISTHVLNIMNSKPMRPCVRLVYTTMRAAKRALARKKRPDCSEKRWFFGSSAKSVAKNRKAFTTETRKHGGEVG